MCGIIGYVGNKKANDILIKGLLALEYRGYDSAGIATLENNELKSMKDKGRVRNILDLDGYNDLKGTYGIAHIPPYIDFYFAFSDLYSIFF